ncbi:hypothetical protein [Bradyrhizobium sp. URHD0069]|uniref:hypothetical protein n=1 Tax=Bradyrhizobium sp. URHD0069 TaxID=1380355 RepID=UPI000B17E28E|nr:hypothetical protein [Bradyrhizobium sp. URHD0069]
MHAADLILTICEVAGSATFLDDIVRDAQTSGLSTAIAARDTSRLFDVILTAFCYQGISDAVARDYMRRHGSASWRQIKENMALKPACPRLKTYWHYDQCRYDKGSGSCSEPEHIGACPLPTHRLRNGRLNQTAYSFYLFTRDIAENDLLGWIDHQLSRVATQASDLSHELELQEALIGPLRHVYGVSDKTLAMTLSELLMGAQKVRPHWFAVGKAMIAVDTLVHNFLHRTGVLTKCNADHAYGPGCYKPGGCADILRSVADLIDARRFNPAFPRVFPRFVQHAIWQYCAADGLDICNGNRIDDRSGCTQHYCNIFDKCSKTRLKTA